MWLMMMKFDKQLTYEDDKLTSNAYIGIKFVKGF